MPASPSNLILADKSETLSAWLKQIKLLGGSYAGLSRPELLSSAEECIAAFSDALDKGDFLKIRIYIEKLSRMRGSKGFKVSEVQRAIYSLYNILKPRVVKLEAEKKVPKGTLDKLNNILTDVLFELSEAFHKILNETIEKYIHEIENANLKLKETSITDDLTGCYNQRYFQEVLDSEIYRAERYNRPFSVMMLDIDHFKRFNDRFGHLFGDQLLRDIGRIIKGSIRNSDTAFRYGGEEFSIIFPETEKDNAFIIAERIRKKISRTAFKVDGKTARITISGGVEGAGPKPFDRTSIIARADKALYLAKKQGRNKVLIYDK